MKRQFDQAVQNILIIRVVLYENKNNSISLVRNIF